MSVAGIPAFLEERLVFMRERANGLYGVESYLLSNFLVSMPFLLIIALSFSVTGYFLMGYQATAEKFFIFVGYMFMMLLVAEAQVVFISVAIPIFVAALTIAAFVNGMWMVVEGFALIKISDIPAGWRYTMHYIDFQKYTFESLLSNELTGLTFTCARTVANTCSCLVPSSTPSTCTFSGNDVLAYYEHTDVKYWVWFLALVGILVVFKFATYLVLKLRGTKL
jgi:ABC-type multidrug transport system permease subunit